MLFAEFVVHGGSGWAGIGVGARDPGEAGGLVARAGRECWQQV
ncbi:hypothetical protein RR42_s1624 [Cupriavidus basilensis]|uniref:Uncharacterized protein n=1 Tax=Cupriavidus basilensis TaxID=68895 RepID=A0A0C4YCB0_9BURK|nr:hypothetical protein RR42_s1624 [Cupriavidus basilensis]